MDKLAKSFALLVGVSVPAVCALGLKPCAKNGDQAVEPGIKVIVKSIDPPPLPKTRTSSSVTGAAKPKYAPKSQVSREFDAGQEVVPSPSSQVRPVEPVPQTGPSKAPRPSALDWFTQLGTVDHFRARDIPSHARTHKPGEMVSYVEFGDSEAARPPYTLERPRVVSIIPVDDEAFKAVYRRSHSPASKKQFRTAEKHFRTKLLGSYGRSATPKTSQVFSDASLGKEQLLESFSSSSSSNTVIVVAHSTAGTPSSRVIPLPNGEEVTVEELHRAALERGKRCLVLTCYGKDFGLEDEITFKDALKVIEAGIEAFDKHELARPITQGSFTPPFWPLSTEDFVGTVREARAHLKLQRRITISTVVVGSGGSLYLMTYESE